MKQLEYTVRMLLGFVFVQILMMFSASAGQNYVTISNCFWVVAPIHELANELQLHDLWSFTQGRVSWLGGYVSANKGNKDFETAFNLNLERRKAVGLSMKEELKRAIQTGNSEKYNEILSKAIACDAVLGIRTDFVPQMGR